MCIMNNNLLQLSIFLFFLHTIVDGNWSAYTPYGECSSKCGGGVQERFRYCNNPSPAFEGKNCAGFSKSVRVCNSHPCKGICSSFILSQTCQDEISRHKKVNYGFFERIFIHRSIFLCFTLDIHHNLLAN